MAATNIGLDEPTTIDLRVAGQNFTRAAQTVIREEVILGNSTDDAGLANVLNTDPVGTEYGLPVRPVSLTPNRTATGTLNALNAAATISAQGAGIVHWEIDTGTLVGTVVFEATLDDTNWFAINAIRISGAIISSTTTFADRGALDSGSYSQVRLRVSAFTSGSSAARLEASVASPLTRLAQALPAGTNNIGDVDVLTLPALPAGANNIGDVDVLTLPALPAGTNNIGDVDVLTLPPLPAGTNNIGDVDIVTMPSVTISVFPDNEPFNLNQLAGTALAVPFDLDTGAGTQNIAGVSLRRSAAGGSVEFGTATDPVRTDPTGTTTQPVSGTVTANAGTGNFNTVGTKTNNGGAPGATNLGALPAVANAAAPTQTEGNQVALRTTLTGDLAVTLDAEAVVLGASAANIGDVDVLTLPALVAGTANIGDVDVLTLPALVAGTANIGDVDILTTVNPANRTASGALGALNAAVTINSEGAGSVAWEIDTGTLVGTVILEGTLDDTNWFTINFVELDGTVSASLTTFGRRGHSQLVGFSQMRLRVSAFTSGTSNARMEASAGSSTEIVVVRALPAGTNNIGDIDVLTLPALVAGTANIGDVDVLTLPALVAGTANIGDVDIASFVAGAITEVQGDVAHDAVSAGNPVLLGVHANTPQDAAPANRASADGDVVRHLGDRDGVTFVHPHGPHIWSASNEYTTAQTDAVVRAAPGVGLSLYITDIYCAVNAAVNVTLEEGTTVFRWRYYGSGQGDGVALSLTTPIKLAANTTLTVTTSAAVTITLIVSGYTAP